MREFILLAESNLGSDYVLSDVKPMGGRIYGKVQKGDRVKLFTTYPGISVASFCDIVRDAFL